MDACLVILTTKSYQVNTCVGRIARRQARLSGFVASPFLSPEASADEDGNDDKDEDASSSSDDKTTTSR